MKRILLIDTGNTNTRFARSNGERIGRVLSMPTAQVLAGAALPPIAAQADGCVLASVVPAATRQLLSRLPVKPLLVSASVDLGIGIRYPRPAQIGADRLANSVGVVHLYGAPAIVVSFGTALAFDIVNPEREYIGGVIAPGLAAMTHYLHEKTALLPRIRPQEPRRLVGKSTRGAMLVGAVVGYRGLVKEILNGLRAEPGMRQAVVVATGGYAQLIAGKIPGIAHVNPQLTLEGLRFIYRHQTQC